MCGDKKHEFLETRFIFVADFSAAKLITYSSLQGCWNVRHLEFENAVANVRLNGPMFSKKPKHVNNDHIEATKALHFRKFLYGCKDATMIWNITMFQYSEDNRLKELETAPWILINKEKFLIFYFDDLIKFAGNDSSTDCLMT